MHVYDCKVIMRQGSSGHGIVFGDRGNWSVVAQLCDGSAAHKAGIEEGDRLTQVDGKDLINSAHLAALLRTLGVDNPVTIRVLRY